MSAPRVIAYLGNFRRPWCTEVHVAASLEALGHRVVRLQEDRTDWADMPRLIDDAGAHMLLWTRTWPAELDKVRPILAELTAREVPTVSYHLDRWFGLNREHQVDDQPFFHTSLVVSPDDSPRWDEHGVEHLWLPPGVFHAECEPVAPNPRRWPYDVVFVGSFPYPHEEWAAYRGELVGRFAATFGSRFTVLPRAGQPVRGRALQELYATVPVILGDSCLAGESHRYWSDRIPETLGRGGLLIHPAIPGDVGIGGEWYDERDMLSYQRGDFDTAVDAARWALAGTTGAEDMRAHGRATVAARDTYVHRMDALLGVVEERFGWREAPEPKPPTSARAPRRRAQRTERADAPLNRLSVRCGPRYRAQFDPRPESTDVSVIEEVWASNDYRVPPHGLRGTVLDVGANVGAFSVLAAKAGASKVVAVEPHPGNRERLVHHLALNGVGDRVVVDNRAVVGGAWSGATALMVGDGGGAHSVQVAVSDVEPVEVATVPLAVLLIEHAPIAFAKVDIEGGEYDAFLGVDAHLMHEHVAEVALEFHGPGMPHLGHLGAEQLDRWKQLVAMLADCGRLEIMGHPTVGGLMWWKRY